MYYTRKYDTKIATSKSENINDQTIHRSPMKKVNIRYCWNFDLFLPHSLINSETKNRIITIPDLHAVFAFWTEKDIFSRTAEKTCPKPIFSRFFALFAVQNPGVFSGFFSLLANHLLVFPIILPSNASVRRFFLVGRKNHGKKRPGKNRFWTGFYHGFFRPLEKNLRTLPTCVHQIKYCYKNRFTNEEILRNTGSLSSIRISFYGHVWSLTKSQGGWSLRVKICPQSIFHKSSEKL